MPEEIDQNSLVVLKECVNRELSEANIYHALLFKLINGLVAAPGFEREFGGLFNYIRDSLETKYVFALGKLFARSQEAGLWRLIERVKAETSEFIELKLERQTFGVDGMRKARTDFLENYSEYEKKIQEINDKINPYRNIQRAHNFPWRKDNGSSTWNETKECLTFAETVFVQAMDGICEGCCRVGDFYPSTLNGEIEFFVLLLNEGLENTKKKKAALLADANGQTEREIE